jgi:hypothetical protein
MIMLGIRTPNLALICQMLALIAVLFPLQPAIGQQCWGGYG